MVARAGARPRKRKPLEAAVPAAPLLPLGACRLRRRSEVRWGHVGHGALRCRLSRPSCLLLGGVLPLAASAMHPVFQSSRRDFTFGPWKLSAARTHIMKSAQAERWGGLGAAGAGAQTGGDGTVPLLLAASPQRAPGLGRGEEPPRGCDLPP